MLWVLWACLLRAMLTEEEDDLSSLFFTISLQDNHQQQHVDCSCVHRMSEANITFNKLRTNSCYQILVLFAFNFITLSFCIWYFQSIFEFIFNSSDCHPRLLWWINHFIDLFIFSNYWDLQQLQLKWLTKLWMRGYWYIRLK